MVESTASSESYGSQNLELSGVYEAADKTSGRGRVTYLALNALRLFSLLVATVVATFDIAIGHVDFSGLVVLSAFLIAAVAEIALISFKPERNWYSGRGVAESVKTLTWRFAVKGEPFGPSMDTTEARNLFIDRIREVLDRGKDRINISSGVSVFTESMLELRDASFTARKQAYLKYRIEEERHWYSLHSHRHEVQANLWKYTFLTAELLAVIAAALSFGRDDPLHFAGIVAAFVGGGAAWLGLTQHSRLAASYGTASVELTLQSHILGTTTEEVWPKAVGDAEEAISREHTLWLVSRGEDPPAPLRSG